jgi:Protein of unknown function (DUF3489)
MTSETATIQAAPAAEPEATTKANLEPRKGRVAPPKAGSKKKTTSTKKAPKSQESAKPAKPAKAPKAKKESRSRQGSKQAQVLDMLRRDGGCTLAEIMARTNWQAHTTRAFISAVVGKKLGLAVSSVKPENGERRYSVKGA